MDAIASNLPVNPAIATLHPATETLPTVANLEQVQTMSAWNHTTVDYPHPKCVHQLFEEQVERTPNEIAVVVPAIASRYGKVEQLTYQELNDRANQLAHHLQHMGVCRDVLVAVNLPRSLDLAIAILGILKAGGAYIPLDPAYPQERLAFMLADTQAAIVLTHTDLAKSLPEHDSRVVCLDADWDLISRYSTAAPTPHATPDSLAYIIYTSGSTGKPKGVMLEHGALANLLFWQRQNSTVTEGARTLQFAALSFDVSFQELFSTWSAGGTLVLISEELRHDAAGLLRLIDNERVERLFLPFIALQHLAEAADTYKQVPASLREVITAGEQLQVNRYITQFFSRLPNCTLYNHYGPSESHVVTAFALTGLPQTWAPLPPIGRPISNTQIHLLNEDLQPVAIGEPGELYIGGVCLARGYLNRPDLTAEKFIPNPFASNNVTATTLYKTGDVARYLPDGNIEYLGRADNQVKIRGFRIELGEVETVLTSHPDVKQSVVLAREDQPGNKRLVAYLVTNNGQPVVTTELRRFLLDKLPDYAVPAAFVTVEAMPRTPSGKVDRRALPAPTRQRPPLEQSYVAPRSEQERLLATIWSTLLDLDQVGIHDDFFDLGGNSLLSLQVVGQVQQALTIEIPVVKLFQHPTIAEFAQNLHRETSDRPSYDKHQDRAQRQKARFDHRKQSIGKRSIL